MAATKTQAPAAQQFSACHRYAGIADRKARRIVDLIRGRKVNQALADLEHDRHRAAPMIRKVLASAVANALQNPAVRASRLVVSAAFVNGGPLLQGRMRFRPGPMGRAMPFRRRTCHIHVHVTDPDVMAEARELADEPMSVPETEAGTEAAPKKKAAAKKATAKSAGAKASPKKASTKKPAAKKAPKKSEDKED
jgi:large subunit ribosomal protein L22